MLEIDLSLFLDQRVYEPFWLGLIGLTWAFHLTFTITMLRQHQPDIRQHGRLFSYAVIYLLNMLGVAIWIVMVASPTLEELVTQMNTDTLRIWTFCWEGVLDAWNALMRRF